MEIPEKIEKERSMFDTTMVCIGLAEQQDKDQDVKVDTLIGKGLRDITVVRSRKLVLRAGEVYP